MDITGACVSLACLYCVVFSVGGQTFVPREVSQCKAGRYRGDCQLECGDNCGDGPGNNFCHQDTGVCYDGCNGNGAGGLCTECKGNFFGNDCKGCQPGYHGEQCTSPCSSLSSRCIRCSQDGTCTACSGQFLPPECTACPDGRYGNLCAMTCSPGCARCEQTSGTCTACDSNSNLALPGCTVNVATNKTYRQISTFPVNGTAGNAADGNTAGSLDANTCSHTDSAKAGVGIPSNEYHWWEVDLGRKYPVHDITVWARTNYNDRLFPFTITVDGQTCVSMVSDPGTRSHSVRCTSLMYGQVVRLTLMKKPLTLNLCELQIFVPSGVSQCPAGHHGAQCGQTCSDNCGGGPGNNFCYQDTGVCFNACQGGWYGHLCKEKCSQGCARCEQISGACTACTNNSNLALPGCTECEDGYYKQSTPPCIQCPGTCDNNTPCDKTTGHCQQCPPGRKGDICDQDCQAGLYGDGCSTRCGYCRVNTTCHHQDGRCPEGCVSGFTEPFCLQGKQESLIAPVVGSVIGAALIIAVAVVAAVCWHRRPRGEPTEKRATLREPGRTRSANKTMDSSDHRPPSSPSPQGDTTYYEISDTANTHEMREVQNNYDVLNHYSNDDADRQPYAQLTSHASDVTK